MALRKRVYFAPEEGGEGSSGGVVDRGDNFQASADTAAVDKAAADAAAEKPVADAAEKAAADAAAEKPVADAAVEKPRDDKGQFIPVGRHKTILENERTAREVAERKLAEATAELNKHNQSASVKELATQITALRNDKAKAILDGDTDKIVALEEEIDGLRDKIAERRGQEQSAATSYEIQENTRLDATVTRLESEYDVLDEHSDGFDQDIVDFILAGQKALMENERLAPSAALAKSADRILSKMKISPKSAKVEPVVDEGKGLGKGQKKLDRETAAAAKNIDAALKTPVDTRDVGLDTDKAGMREGLPTPTSVDDLKAIPDATLRRMRGDSL